MEDKAMTPEVLDRYMAEKLMGFEHGMGGNYWRVLNENKDCERLIQKKDWHPTKDLNQAIKMCVEKAAEKGWYRFDLGTLINYEVKSPKVVKYVASFAKLETPWIG